ncbi:hypothetical protein NDA00_28305 [Funiculus sociatus GB2-M2]|uniref:hypothetical protein n=1 Tax=Cyanophyceae TaxID=3028117 RepID=UPI0018F027E7|nr:hypothetical protein [Trichocoleus sp. FACHB-90]
MSFASVNNTIYAARKLVYYLKGELKPVNSQTTQNQLTSPADESAIRAFHHQMIDAWNRGSGEDFAARLAKLPISSRSRERISRVEKRSLHLISKLSIRLSKKHT